MEHLEKYLYIFGYAKDERVLHNEEPLI